MFVPSAARRAKKPGGACDDNRLSTEVNRYSQRLDRRLRGPAGGLAFARRNAKTSFEDFVAQSKKIGELYSNLPKVAFKPVEEAIAKSQGTR